MKKLVFFFFLATCCFSVFAVSNVGDYVIDDIKYDYAKDIVRYMKDNDYLNTYNSYEIEAGDDGDWGLYLWKNDEYYQITFKSNSIHIMSLDSIETKKTDYQILQVINEVNYERANWGTWIFHTFSDGDKVLFYSLRTSNLISPKAFLDVFKTFCLVYSFGYSDITSKL